MTTAPPLTESAFQQQVVKVLAEYRADHNDQLEPGRLCHCDTCYRAIAILRRTGEQR